MCVKYAGIGVTPRNGQNRRGLSWKCPGEAPRSSLPRRALPIQPVERNRRSALANGDSIGGRSRQHAPGRGGGRIPSRSRPGDIDLGPRLSPPASRSTPRPRERRPGDRGSPRRRDRRPDADSPELRLPTIQEVSNTGLATGRSPEYRAIGTRSTSAMVTIRPSPHAGQAARHRAGVITTANPSPRHGGPPSDLAGTPSNSGSRLGTEKIARLGLARGVAAPHRRSALETRRFRATLARLKAWRKARFPPS
jgi:hypothetical protein